ncbi:hypothetical protein FQZ97_746300 [compost metagenome]
MARALRRRAGLGNQQLLLHQRRIPAADIRVDARQGDLLVERGHAVEGEVPALLRTGDQLHHFAGAAQRQIEIDAGVIGVGRAPVALQWVDRRRHGVEQPNEVDAHIALPAETGDQAELASPQHLGQQAALGLEQLIGKMPGCRRAPAEAEEIELQGADTGAWVGFQETAQL